MQIELTSCCTGGFGFGDGPKDSFGEVWLLIYLLKNIRYICTYIISVMFDLASGFLIWTVVNFMCLDSIFSVPLYLFFIAHFNGYCKVQGLFAALILSPLDIFLCSLRFKIVENYCFTLISVLLYALFLLLQALTRFFFPVLILTAFFTAEPTWFPSRIDQPLAHHLLPHLSDAQTRSWLFHARTWHQ